MDVRDDCAGLISSERQDANSRPVERQSTYHGCDLSSYDEKYGRKNVQSQSLFRGLLANVKCSKRVMIKCIQQWIPAVEMIRQYQIRHDLLGDIISGLSVGVMTIPQSMGYSLLASIPAQYGLYTSLFPVLIYFLFGSSRHVSIGTMALSSLVVRSAVERGKVTASSVTSLQQQVDNLFNDTAATTYTTAQPLLSDDQSADVLIAVSVSLTAGIFLLIMSFFRLGFIVTYMSDSFISGYLAASNMIVLAHQFKLVLGVPTKHHSAVLEFFYLVYDIFSNIHHTNLIQLLISVLTISTLVLVKFCINERFKSRLKVPVPIDLIVVIIATTICHFADLKQNFQVQVLKPIPWGIPAPTIPSLEIMWKYVFEAVMLAIVSYMMVAMMATLFAQRHNYSIDNNQELAANGLSCIFGSFFNSICPSTSPPRCFLMESTGGRTQVTYLISAILVLVTLLAIAPLFKSLPICVLACIVIVACIPLFVHYTAWIGYWKTDRYDFAIWVVTFVMTFVAGVDYGLLIGVGFSLCVVHFRLQQSHGSVLLPSSDGSFIMLNSKLYSNVSHLAGTYVYQFVGPLYFATLASFKEGLFKKTVSISELKLWNETYNKFRLDESTTQGQQCSTCRKQKLSEEETVDIGEHLKDRETKLDGGKVVENGLKSVVVDQLQTTADDVSGVKTCEEPCCGGDNKPVISMPKYVIISCSAIPFVDTSGAKLLAQLHDAYNQCGVRLILTECNENVLYRLNLVEQCKPFRSGAVYPTVQDALIDLRVSYSSGSNC